jgi:hypothetical protein
MTTRPLLAASVAAICFSLLPRAVLGQTAEFTSLTIMRDKGIITQAEYDSALRDLATTNGARGAESTSLVVGKWSTTIYGFLESDFIHDSTQSFNDVAGNAQVQRPAGRPLPPPAVPTTYAGDNGRTMFSVRNSRFGLRLRAPEYHRVRVSGLLEMDFLGNQPAVNQATGSITEQAFFTSPTFRIRHAMAKIETPFIDVLVGQYWDLFGWQGVYQPNTVEIQGIPGELYSRDPQIRLSKTFATEAVTLEVAAAALRPVSSDSQVPEWQGGLRFAVNHWTATHTQGATATQVMPASIAVTGDERHVVVPEFLQIPTQSVALDMASIAVDAFVPILASKTEKEHSLSISGEFVYGNGSNTLYTGLTGGMGFPTIANMANLNPAAPWPQNIDNGIVVYDLGSATQSPSLHPIQWTTVLANLQYYLPKVAGRIWISGNYAHIQSANTNGYVSPPGFTPNPQVTSYVPAEQVRRAEDFWDVNLFGQVTPAFRVGAEFAEFLDHYVDGTTPSNQPCIVGRSPGVPCSGSLAINQRVQISGFLVF